MIEEKSRNVEQTQMNPNDTSEQIDIFQKKTIDPGMTASIFYKDEGHDSSQKQHELQEEEKESYGETEKIEKAKVSSLDGPDPQNVNF